MNWKNKPVSVLIGLLLIHVIAHIDRNMLLGFPPQITQDLSLNNQQYGILTGAVLVLSFGFMAVFMGSLADRFSRTKVMAFGVLVCAPLMLAYRFAAPGSALFFVGMCAGFFLPLACYGPANALIQALTPAHMRSTVTGATMMLINVFAIALGNLVVGAVSDRLAASGSTTALTTVLVATDVLVALALWFYWRAANSAEEDLGMPADKSIFAH